MDDQVKVLQFPKPKPDIKAATCGCDGQTFILVCDANKQPDFVYCTTCQRRQLLIRWAWVSPDSASEPNNGTG